MVYAMAPIVPPMPQGQEMKQFEQPWNFIPDSIVIVMTAITFAIPQIKNARVKGLRRPNLNTKSFS